MNHLAHLLLAGNDEELRLGALLGDHIKGRAALDSLPPGLARGVRLHRLIDSQSDAHPSVRAMLARLNPPFRRYGGVILDILFDRMLTWHWDRFAGVPLAAFADATDELLSRHRALLPERLERFALWARMSGLWMRFGEDAMLQEVFRLVGARHGRPSPLPRGLEVLQAHERAIEETFLALYPDLERAALDFRDGTGR